MIAILMIASSYGSCCPVYAHYTLGELSGNAPRYRRYDYERTPQHKTGLIGYVWPGSGWGQFPGYETPGDPLSTNYYSPWGAILTSTDEHQNRGDLIFAVNYSDPNGLLTTPLSYSVTIAVPPEFEPSESSRVVTTTCNAAGSPGRRDLKDPFAPGWWIICLGGVAFYPGTDNWYFARINDIAAPKIAGRYFFKLLFDNRTAPVENFPVLLVEGEIDPAIIYGTVRYGGWNVSQYNQPIHLAGRVRAVGTAEDPYTGRSTGRRVEARAYFNASAHGHYELEGLAPGLYTIYASAAGYPERIVWENVRVLKGQSLQLDLRLYPGAVVSGVVFSKNGLGTEKWAGLRPIAIEIYDAPIYTEDHLVAFSPVNLTRPPYTSYTQGDVIWRNGIAQFTPRLVAFPWEGPSPGKDPFGLHNGVGPAQYWWVDPDGLYTNGGGSFSFIFKFGVQGRYGVPTEWSGHIPQEFASWINGLGAGAYYLRAWINGYVQTVDGVSVKDYDVIVPDGRWAGDARIEMDLWKYSGFNIVVHFHNEQGKSYSDPIGGPDPGRYLIVEAYHDGRLQGVNFTYVGKGNSSYQIALNGLGMAGPDNTPTYIANPHRWMKFFEWKYYGLRDSGLIPGIYTIRAYTRGYLVAQVQSSTGSSHQATNVSLHLVRGPGINVTVNSIDWQRPATSVPWKYPSSAVNIGIYNSASVWIGAILFWDDTTKLWSVPTQHTSEVTLPFVKWRTEYGLGASYLVFNGSTGCEQGFGIAIASGTRPTAVENGSYSLRTFTYGYVQKAFPQVRITERQLLVNVGLRLIVGAEIDATVLFKLQKLISPTSHSMWYRLRVFDADRRLRAGALGTVPAGSASIRITTAGFSGYADPNIATISYTSMLEGSVPSNYGLDKGTYNVTMEVVNLQSTNPYVFGLVPGLLMGDPWYRYGPYRQGTVVMASVGLGGSASVIFEIDRLGVVGGRVFAFNWNDDLRTASWVAIKASGSEELVTHSFDGHFDMILSTGTYTLTATEWSIRGEGHTSASIALVVTEGSIYQSIDFVLARSEIPISEFPRVASTMTISCLVLTLSSRRYRRGRRRND